MPADPTPPPVPEALPLPAVEMAALRLFAGFDLAENATPDVIALAWEKLTDTEREQWRYAARSALTVAATLVATPAYDRGVAAGRTAAAADHLIELIQDLADPDPCTFDHHGYCQAHGWMATDPHCPHARARDVLGAARIAEGKTDD